MSSTRTADTIAIVAAVGLGLAPVAVERLPQARIVYPVAGLSLLAMTGKGNRDESEQAAKPVQYAISGVESLSEGLAGMFQRLSQQGVSQARKIAVKYDCPALPKVFQHSEGKSKLSNAFSQIHDKSFLLVGNTDAGKTHFLHQVFAELFSKGEFCRVVDRCYNKRNMRWFDAPVGNIATGRPGIVYKQDDSDPDTNRRNLEQLIEQFYQERNRRAAETANRGEQGKDALTYPKWFLFWPERNEALNDYKNNRTPEQYEALVKKVDSIFVDGHGYNVFICSDGHSAATGLSAISESGRKQLHWAFLGDGVEQTELGKVGIPKEWISAVSEARESHGKYVGVGKINGRVQLIKAPANDWDFSESISVEQDALMWIDNEGPIIAGVRKFLIGDGKSVSPSAMFDSCKEIFPQGYKNKGADNPYWQAFKSFVESQENN